jgi:type IV fimbrial biogenesis protein FimT
MSNQNKRHSGFTMIEMLVSVGVFAMLAAIAAPSFRNYTAAQSIRTTSFNLTTALMLARSEAIKRNRSVTIAASGGSWQNGWEITAAGSAETLQSTDPLRSDVLVGSEAPATIVFQPTGRVASVGTVRVPLSVSRGYATLSRCITLDPGGMPKVAEVACQ